MPANCELPLIKKPRMGIRGFKRGGSPQCPAVKPEHFRSIIGALLLGLFLFPLFPTGFPRLIGLHRRHDIANTGLDILKGAVAAAPEIRYHHLPEIINVAFRIDLSMFLENLDLKILLMDVDLDFFGG